MTQPMPEFRERTVNPSTLDYLSKRRVPEVLLRASGQGRGKGEAARDKRGALNSALAATFDRF